MLSDLKALYDMVDSLRKWFSGVTEKHDDEKLQQAAKLLTSSGTVVASLRTLDNSFRDVMGVLRHFDSDWPPERRETVREKIRQLADQERILVYLRQALTDLESMRIEDDLTAEEKERVQTIISHAKDLQDAIGGSGVTPFPSEHIMLRFLDAIKFAQVSDEVQSVRQEAHKYLSKIDRQIMAKVDIAFAELRGSILERHPALPDPGWAVEI